MQIELQPLTEIRNGTITGPLCPVTSAENFLRQTVNAPLLKLWRICADMSFQDGAETGTCDLLLALIGGKALVALLDSGCETCPVALKNNGAEPHFFRRWRDRFKFHHAPTDQQLTAVLNAIDIDSEIAAIKIQLELADLGN